MGWKKRGKEGLGQVAIALSSLEVVLEEQAIGLHELGGDGAYGLLEVLLPCAFIALPLDEEAAPAF